MNSLQSVQSEIAATKAAMCAAVIQDRRGRACRRDLYQVPAVSGIQSFEARSEPLSAAARPRWKGPLVWLFIPPKDMTSFSASAFALVSQDSISAFTSQNPDIGLHVMSSETVSLRPLSWHGWRMRPWLLLLSGTISNPSMAALGVAEFISSLPVIPASGNGVVPLAAARAWRLLKAELMA